MDPKSYLLIRRFLHCIAWANDPGFNPKRDCASGTGYNLFSHPVSLGFNPKRLLLVEPFSR